MLLGSCNGRTEATPDSLDRAEEAFEQGRYAGAQSICDTLMLGNRFEHLDTRQLCRLALLFMRLAENSTTTEDVNTAFAARSLAAALHRDSDSTVAYIGRMVPEDQAKIMILSALNQAQHSAPEEGEAEEVNYNDSIPQ